MPITKLQDFIYTILMSFIMVYAMICYNISLALGGMSNAVFLNAFHELIIMWPLGAVLELLIAGRCAKKLAFRFISPEDKPIFIVNSISSIIVCLMCPMMSMAATILFFGINSEMIAVWLQKLVCNFPMALCFQIFFAGPFVRNIFTHFQKN